MTDQSRNNRRPLEAGHRYAPRRASIHHEETRPSHMQASVTASSQEAPVKNQGVSTRQRVVATAKPAKPRQNRSLVLKRRGLNRPKAAVVVAPVVAPAEPAVQPTTQKHRRSRFHPANTHPALVFMGAAVLAAVLVFGGGLLLFKSKKESSDKYTLGASHSQTLGATTTTSNDASRLNELAPTSEEMAAYRTAPGDPRYLKIPKMQLNARVIAMNVGKDGLPGIPQNIYDAGWFVRSATPGANGVMLVNGQVVGNTKPGAFDALTSLAVGDVVQIERGDGKLLTYKVTKIDQYDPTKLTIDEALKPADSVKPGLNLLAANGRYNVKTNTFEKRLVVRTVQQ